VQRLREKKAISDEIENDLKQSLADFKQTWSEKVQAAAA